MTAVTFKTARTCGCGEPETSEEHAEDGHRFVARSTVESVRTEMRGWVADCIGYQVELLTDGDVRACITREYDGGLPGFLAANAHDDLTDTGRAWLEANPLLGVDPDGEPLAIWTAITTYFTDGWDGFAAFYAATCVCGCVRESPEHGDDGHPFQSRDTRQEIPA